MAFNRRGRRPMPVGGDSAVEDTSPNRQMGGARFAPRGAQRFGVNPGPMPVGGEQGTGDTSPNRPRRQDPRFVRPQNNNIPYGGEQGNNFTPRLNQNQGSGMAGSGLAKDPRYVKPLGQMNQRPRSFNRNNFGGNSFGGGSDNITYEGHQGDNFGAGRKQDPRYVQPENNIPFSQPANQRGRFSTGNMGAGRRPAGLPNIEMRKPGSGGSRVMNTPSMGRRNFMRPNQPNQPNNLLGGRRNGNKNNQGGY